MLSNRSLWRSPLPVSSLLLISVMMCVLSGPVHITLSVVLVLRCFVTTRHQRLNDGTGTTRSEIDVTSWIDTRCTVWRRNPSHWDNRRIFGNRCGRLCRCTFSLQFSIVLARWQHLKQQLHEAFCFYNETQIYTGISSNRIQLLQSSVIFSNTDRIDWSCTVLFFLPSFFSVGVSFLWIRLVWLIKCDDDDWSGSDITYLSGNEVVCYPKSYVVTNATFVLCYK